MEAVIGEQHLNLAVPSLQAKELEAFSDIAWERTIKR
jgi:hypothetical protein